VNTKTLSVNPSLNSESIHNAAQILWKATQNVGAIERITAQFGDFSLKDAYAIQQFGMALRQKAGSEWIGWKMGLTSKAKREQMSLDSAIFGYLFKEGMLPPESVSLGGLIHPKAEPEIGFRMKKKLKGKVSFQEACDSIGAVCAAIEIIDSRYTGFKYFSLPDVIADNCSAGRFVWGPEQAFDSGLDLSKAKMNFYIDDQLQASVLGEEISGHPVHSLMQLAELLAEHELDVPAGALVLAGAATPAASLKPGQRVLLEVEGLKSLGFETSVR
jgi:2-oxo-3-hexenedioate decarboxylase